MMSGRGLAVLSLGAYLAACDAGTSVPGTAAVVDSAGPLSVTVFASPTAGVAPLTVDFASVVTGGAGEPSYFWSFGDGASDSLPDSEHVYAEPGLYVASLTVTDATGDEAHHAVQIVVAAEETPAVVASAVPSSGIAPLDVQFHATVAGVDQPVTYAWDFGDGSGASSEAEPRYTYAAGTYTATVTVTDADGDVATAGVDIAVAADEPLGAITTTATPTLGLAPLLVRFTCDATGGNAPVRYEWDFDDGSRAAEASPAHVYLASGVYTARCTAVDADGDVVSDTVVLTVYGNSAPSVQILASPESGVEPLDVAWSSVVAGGNGVLTYAWDFDDGSGETIASPSHTFAAGSFIVTLTVTDEAGLEATAVLPLTVEADSVPVVTASASPRAGVAPLAVDFTANAAGGNGPRSFSWDFDDGSVPGGAALAAHTYATPGTYQATVTVTDADGDTGMALLDIDVVADLQPAQPTVSATPSSGYAPLASRLSCSATGGNAPLRYSWSFGDGATAVGDAATHVYHAAGVFTATCTVVDADGDESSATTTVTSQLYDPPRVQALAAPALGVAPLAVAFTSLVSGGVAPFSYSWDFDDGNSSTSAEPVSTFTAAGLYAVLLTVTDATGAVSEAGVLVDVAADSVPELLVGTTTLSGAVPLDVGFEALVSGGNAPVTVTWDFGDGTSSSSPRTWHSFASAGTFNVSATAVDADGDVASASVAITVVADAAPAISSATAAPASGFAPLATSLSCAASGGNGALSYAWDFGDGQSGSGAGATHTYFSSGTYTATCAVTDEDGDRVTRTAVVFVVGNDPPTAVIDVSGAYASADGRYALRGRRVDLDGTGSLSGAGADDAGDDVVAYAWSFDRQPVGSVTSVSNPSSGNSSFVPDLPGDYVVRLTVTDSTGLSSSSTHLVTAELGCAVSVVGGNGQTVVVDQYFATPIQVEVRTPLGNIRAADVGLVWGGANIVWPVAASVTDALGQSAQRPRAGTSAGAAQSFTVAVAENPAACSATVTASFQPAAATHLWVTPPATLSLDTVAAGNRPRISGFVSDRFGNAVTGVDTTVMLALGTESRQDGPFPSNPGSVFFHSLTAGTQVGGSFGSPGDRFLQLATSAGTFGAALDTADHEAEFYTISVNTTSGLEPISDWQSYYTDDFETDPQARWSLESDWEVGGIGSGPGSAASGVAGLATRLGSDHDLLMWQRRTAWTSIALDLPRGTELELGFMHWIDAHDAVCAGFSGPAGGYVTVDRLMWPNSLQPQPAYDRVNCNGNRIYTGASLDWQPVTVGLDQGSWGYDLSQLEADEDWLGVGFVFEETNNQEARPGWYIDDLSLRYREHWNFRGKLTFGAPNRLAYLHAGSFVGQPMPPGLAGNITCPFGGDGRQPIDIIVVVVDQFMNRVEDDFTTTFEVTLLQDSSGNPAPTGMTGVSLFNLTEWFGDPTSPPFYLGTIVSTPNPYTARVRVQEGVVALSFTDTAPEAVIVRTTNVGTLVPAADEPTSFVPDVDAESDGWSLGCGDCQETNPSVNPGAPEVCTDGVDNNCDDRRDCYDGACTTVPRCFGRESCAPVGFTLDLGQFTDNVCDYNNDFTLQAACGSPMMSAQDAVYVYVASGSGSHGVDLQTMGFGGQFQLMVGSSVCDGSMWAMCAGGGNFDVPMNAGQLLTIAVDASSGTSGSQCGDISVRLEERF